MSVSWFGEESCLQLSVFVDIDAGVEEGDFFSFFLPI